MKTAFIVDTLWTGHIPGYHQNILKTLKDMGVQTISVSPKPEEVKSWGLATQVLKVSEFTHNNEKGPINYFLKKSGHLHFHRARLFFKSLSSQIKELNPKDYFIFFPYIDNLVISPVMNGFFMDKFFPHPWSALYVTPKYLRKSGFKFFYKSLLRKDRFFNAKNCLAISVLDEGVVPRLSSLFPNKKNLVMPEFTNTETEAGALVAKLQEFKSGKKLIGLFGEISKRKGVETLLKAAIEMKDNGNYGFVFVGPMNEKNNSKQDLIDIKSLITQTSGNCFFHLDRVPKEEEFNELMKTCDIIYAAYHDFYNSSNIMTKAAALYKPMIVSKGFCMGERVEKYKMGKTIKEGSVSQTVDAVKQLTTEKQENSNFSQYVEANSAKALEKFLKNF